PFLLKTADNPEGLDGAVFATLRSVWQKDFPKFMADNARPFFVPETSQQIIDWGLNMMGSCVLPVAIACNHAFTETDFRPDLARIRIPTLVIHGDHDASAPIALTGKRTAQMIAGSTFKVYEGGPHGLFFTHKDRLNNDLVAFIAG